MEQNKNQNQVANKNQMPVAFLDARVAISRDGEYLLHFQEDGKIIRKHINLYKHLMKVPYERKTSLLVKAN